MKVPLLSRSEGGGGGLLARALGTVALATVFAVSVGAGLATAAEQPAGPSGPVASAPAKPILKVAVIGDSFTSGEGASSSTYKTVLAPDMTEDGIPFQSYQIDPAHQSSTAPTLQALNQIQAANPGVDIQVSFVPVSGATRDSLYQKTQPGTAFEQDPQINAVTGADIVIVGVGGNDAKFTSWIKTALFSTDATSAQAFPQFMQQFNDGTYLANQTTLLNKISDLAAPGATIVSLGYPKAMPDTIPGSSALWSPFSWSTISQGEANLSNQLATTLNTNNQDASFLAASQHPGQQWLYADVSNALQGHELFTSQEGLNGLTPTNQQGSYHPNDLGQQLLASVLQPYVEQAVNGQLSKWGVQGAENVPPVTPTFSNQWNLRVDIPLQLQPNQPPATPPAADQPKTPPAQDTPAQAPSDKPADQGKNQPDGTDQAKPAQSAPEPATPAQPDTGKPDTTAVGPEVSKPTPPDAPSSAQPDASKPATPADTPSAGTPPAPADTPATPADTQPAKAPADATGTPAGADTPAAPADTPGARTPADGTAATPGQADTPGGTPADTQPAANTPGTPAAADNPAATPPAPGDTPATPAAGDTPAAPPAAPPAADTPAAPPAADTPAAPVAPAPVDTPAAPAPVDTPPAPAAPAPVIVPPAPAAPPPVDIPAPALPAPVVIPDPAPIITLPVDIAPPPPVIAPVPPPPVVPVNPVDTGSSSDSGLGSVDGLGSGSTDTGLGSGLDSGGGIDTGGFTGGDGGGD